MNDAITSVFSHGEHMVAPVAPSTEVQAGFSTAREGMDPVTALHWCLARVSKVIGERVAEGVGALNAPLPNDMSLEFPSETRNPLDLFTEYLGRPGSVVARRTDCDIDIIVHRNDPDRLTDQNAGLFYTAAGRTLGDVFGPARPRPVAGPQGLSEVMRDIGAYLIARSCNDEPYSSRWRNALERAGVDQYAFLTGPVANRVVDGTVLEEKDCGEERWGLETASALLSVIVDSVGEDAVRDFADDLRARCGLADGGRAPGAFEAVDGKLLVAILGLARFRALDPHVPASFVEVFGSKELAHRLRAWCWLWTGSEGDETRPAPNRLADIVLRRIGWARSWEGKAQGDALLDELRKDADAFPRRLADSSPIPAVTTVSSGLQAEAGVLDLSAPVTEDSEAAGSLSATGDGERGCTRLLHLDEVYRFRPISIALLGGSGVGKTSFLRAVLNELMERRSELFPGADELVLADRCSEAIRNDIQSWREGESTSPTSDAVLDYVVELPRVMTIRLLDHRGALLGGGSSGDASVEAQKRELTEAMKSVDGIAAFVSMESLVREARGDRVAADQRVPDLDAIADRLGRAMSARQSDHQAIALVVNKLDEILSDPDDLCSMYEIGRVFGDGVSGGYLPRVGTHWLMDWSARQPIATLSLTAQSIVSRSLKGLSPVFAQLVAHTRRVELFFTSSKPVCVQGDPATSIGPAAIISWLLKDNLIPAFISQATARIATDREIVGSARKDYDVARRIAKLVAVDPRAGAALSVFPGVNKVARKMRARRIVLLSEILRRYGIELSKEPDNGELRSTCDRLDARIAHTANEIDAMEERLEDFSTRFRRV